MPEHFFFFNWALRLYLKKKVKFESQNFPSKIFNESEMASKPMRPSSKNTLLKVVILGTCILCVIIMRFVHSNFATFAQIAIFFACIFRSILVRYLEFSVVVFFYLKMFISFTWFKVMAELVKVVSWIASFQIISTKTVSIRLA